MLQTPAPGGGSYRSYKIDTDNVKTWILSTASSCQYPVAPASRTKGAPGTGQIIGTAELLRQAQYLADVGKPKVNVSSSIRNALQRAITTRRRFYEYYQARADTSPAVEASNSRHRYFIEVFERIIILLTPCFTEDLHNDGDGADSMDALRNQYQGLGVEETDENTYKDWAAPQPELQIPAGDLCELESESDDLLFELHCHFRDLNEYQQYIKDLSNKFRDGELDLITFALACDIIIAIVNDMNINLPPTTLSVLAKRTLSMT
jgi:hypothetical protein